MIIIVIGQVSRFHCLAISYIIVDILKEFNPHLTSYSTLYCVSMFADDSKKYSGLNRAKTASKAK